MHNASAKITRNKHIALLLMDLVDRPPRHSIASIEQHEVASVEKNDHTESIALQLFRYSRRLVGASDISVLFPDGDFRDRLDQCMIWTTQTLTLGAPTS